MNSYENDSFYDHMLDSIYTVCLEYMEPEASSALKRRKERAETEKLKKMFAFMNAARKAEKAEQFFQKREHAYYERLMEQNKIPYFQNDPHHSFVRADACREEILETIVKEIKTGIHSGMAASVCRNRLKMFRQIMESVGVEQKDVDVYAVKLNPEQKEVFEYLRNWENNFVKQEDHTEIQLPNGISDVQTAVSFLADIYKNVYYNLSPDFMEKITPIVTIPKKSKMSFDALMEKSKEPTAMSAKTRNADLSSPEQVRNGAKLS